MPIRRISLSWQTLPHSVRIAIALWVALLAGVTGRVALSKPLSQTVVPIYRTAGERWLASADLYEPIRGMDLYRNPPGMAAAFVPLALLPGKVAGIAWRLGSATVFLVGLMRFRRAVAPDLSPERVGWLFAIAAVLIVQSVNNGQVNVLLAGACLGGTAAAVERRWWAATAWFGIGFGLKLYPVAVGMLVAVMAPRSLAPRLAVVCLAVAVAPFALHDPGYVIDQHRSFVHLLGLDDRTQATLDRVPRDWTILPRVWLRETPSAATGKLVSAAAGAMMAGFVWLAGRRGTDRQELAGLALVLGTIWMTAFGPATESPTYSLLAGVGGLLAVRLPRGQVARPLALAGCGLLAVTVLRAAFPNDWKFHAAGTQPAAALMLLASAVLHTAHGWPAKPAEARTFAGRVRVPTPARTRAVIDVLAGK